MQGTIPSRHPKYRTKLCRNLATGDCPFGQKCSFLHPAPKIVPTVSSLAQQLFPWNPFLLPQLLALSNQQATRKAMPRRSPPRSQGPRLIEEDPSPTTSLLLSQSDDTPSGLVPQTRRSGKRKKVPCRHFVRTGGWCPAGGQCKFLHDVDALPSSDGQKTEPTPPFTSDAHGEGRQGINGGVLVGRQPPSPPIAYQMRSGPPRYAEAELIRQYPPMYRPNYAWQPYQGYCPTMPSTTTMSVPAPLDPSLVAQHNVHPRPQPQVQTAPASENHNSVPLGSYEMNGTMYYNVTSMAPVRAPPPIPYSLPVQPPAYSPGTAPQYPYYAPPGLPAGYYDVHQTTAGPQISTAFDPFASERTVPGDLPVIPRLEQYPISPVQQDVLARPPLGASTTVASGTLGATNAAVKPAPEHEFPYSPPREQQVGHARRVSVNIKKHGRVHSG